MSADAANARPVDMKFEIVVVPVSDVRSRQALLRRLGVAARCRLRQQWRLPCDPVHAAQLRVLGDLRQERDRRGTRFRPGAVLIVSDIAAARADLFSRGVEISEVFHAAGSVYAGPDEPYLFGRRRVSGPDPEHTSYRSFASFSDPDGNGWLFQEITTRLPGRVARATTFASPSELAAALRRAEAAHGEHEKRLGRRDEGWPEWYAEYMVREQSGTELPA
jgi:hypothetical protein